MAKDPGRRYDTAGALADDLRRFLKGEPVRARPPGRGQKLRRWCRRNPRTAILGVTTFLLLIAGLLAVWLGWQRQPPAIPMHELQRKARLEQEFLEFRRNGNWQGALAHARELLTFCNRWYGPKDRRTREARLRFELMEYIADHLSPEDQGALARAFWLEAEKDAVLESGRLADGIALQRQALEIKMACFREKDRPNSFREGNWEVAGTMHYLGFLLLASGKAEDLTEAQKWCEQALEIFERLPEDLFIGETSTIRNNLGMIHYKKGEYVEAEKLLRENLAIRSKSLGKEDPLTIISSLNLANVLLKLGGKENVEKAESLFEDAEVICDKLRPEETHTPGICITLAKHLDDQGKHADAEPYLRKALTPQAKASLETAKICSLLAANLEAQHREEDARPFRRIALIILTQHVAGGAADSLASPKLPWQLLPALDRK
jgi:tetratricopeptide (TPR) repeat protein